MYFDELIQRSYIKAEPPNDEEVVLLMAGCQSQIDRHLVVSKSDFEDILISHRAKDPTSEAVMMAIGRPGITLGDPIWNTMLQRESVIDRYTQLCNKEAVQTLSSLESASSDIPEPGPADMGFGLPTDESGMGFDPSGAPAEGLDGFQTEEGWGATPEPVPQSACFGEDPSWTAGPEAAEPTPEEGWWSGGEAAASGVPAEESGWPETPMPEESGMGFGLPAEGEDPRLAGFGLPLDGEDSSLAGFGLPPEGEDPCLAGFSLPNEEPAADLNGFSMSEGDGAEGYGLPAEDGAGVNDSFGIEPEVTPVAEQAMNDFGIPAGDDCMGLYLDSPLQHLPYAADVSPEEDSVAEEAPSPGISDTAGGFTEGSAEAGFTQEAMEQGTSEFPPSPLDSFGQEGEAPTPSPLEWGGGADVPVSEGEPAPEAWGTPMPAGEESGLDGSADQFVSEEGSIPSNADGSGLPDASIWGVSEPMPGDVPPAAESILGADSVGVGAFPPVSDNMEGASQEEGEQFTPPNQSLLRDLMGLAPEGESSGLPAEGTGEQLFDTVYAGEADAQAGEEALLPQDEIGAPVGLSPNLSAMEHFDVAGYVPPAPLEQSAEERFAVPESSGHQGIRPGFQYDAAPQGLNGLGQLASTATEDEVPPRGTCDEFEAPLPVEDKDIVRQEGPTMYTGTEQDAGVGEGFGLDGTGMTEPPVPVGEPEPDPASTSTPEQTGTGHSDEVQQMIAGIRKSFDLFHSLVKQHSLAVILGSEGLTAEEYCAQLVEEFPAFAGQFEDSMRTYPQDYDRAACALVQLLQMEAESAVMSGNQEQAEKCITPVYRLIYS